MSQESTSIANLQEVKSHPQFQSILFGSVTTEVKFEPPQFFRDLNLDQVVASMTGGRDEYSLAPFFYTLLDAWELVEHRQNVFRDLEDEETLTAIRSFGEKMRVMRGDLALSEKLSYKRQKQAWFVEAVAAYGDALRDLTSALERATLASAGLVLFREYISAYTASPELAPLIAETRDLKRDLLGIRYSLHIHENRVEVAPYNSESDYGADVLQTFEKFRQNESHGYRFRVDTTLEMNHVEAAILDLVAQLYPQIFERLDTYCERHRNYLDSVIVRFDREVQFYIAVIEHTERLRKSGVHFCLPTVSDRSKEVCARDVFDLALANKLAAENKRVVVNDFHLTGPERILVVTGPNQGGKTTFARALGQLHYFAKIGCPVPCSEAKLFFCDQIFTHFEREEDIHNLTGKLEDDLLRIREILDSATSRGILIMNESFLSTTLSDALFLSKEVMRKVINRDMMCVCVTFLDDLASLDKSTVSMVSTVDPKDPAIRTFKLVRKPADGLAYADALAHKYGLCYGDVKRRIAEPEKGRS